MAARLHRERGGAFERLIEHARRADNPYEETWGLGNLAYALVDGPTPISQGLPRLQELLKQARGGVREVPVLAAIGAIEAMLGRLDDARGKIAQARETAYEVGARWYVGLLDLWSSRVELLGQEPGCGRARSTGGRNDLRRDGRVVVPDTRRH